MLLVVLCSFSASVVKQNLKFFSPSTYRNWWIATPDYVTAFSANNYYYSKLGKTLTKVLPGVAGCLKRSASCLRAAIVVNFCQEIFLAQCKFLTRKTKTSRTDCFKVCPPAISYPVEEILSSAWKQRVASSTLAFDFALLAQRSLLPNQFSRFLKIKSRDSASKNKHHPDLIMLLLILAGV